MQRLLATVLFGAVTVSGLHARFVDHLWEPDELAEKAEIICNGIPTEIEVSDKKYPIKYGDVTYPMKTVTATIQVIATTKGSVPQKIQLRYPGMGHELMPMNGPNQIYMQKGKRYRFYLKTVKNKPWYAGVCDGLFDDGQAVEPLADGEPDDSPPLSKTEAVQLAKRWLNQHSPAYAADENCVHTDIGYFSGRWIFILDHKGCPHPYCQARIDIRADRKITGGSWFSEDAPDADREPDDHYLGKEVIISYKTADEHRPEGTTHTIRGIIEKITNQEIAGRFAWGLTPDEQRHFITIERKNLLSIQRIKTAETLH